MGDCLLWAVYRKLQKYVVHNLGLLFPWSGFCINFEKKIDGLNFGRLFHKLIWSPWRQIGNRTAAVSQEANRAWQRILLVVDVSGRHDGDEGLWGRFNESVPDTIYGRNKIRVQFKAIIINDFA
jgi:hypothetical protein